MELRNRKGLKILGGYTCIIGWLNVLGGASPDSRFFAIDDVVVRLLGAAFIALGAGVLLKRRGMLLPLAVVYLLSLIEVALTTPASPAPFSILVFFGLSLGVPLWYLDRCHRDDQKEQRLAAQSAFTLFVNERATVSHPYSAGDMEAAEETCRSEQRTEQQEGEQTVQRF